MSRRRVLREQSRNRATRRIHIEWSMNDVVMTPLWYCIREDVRRRLSHYGSEDERDHERTVLPERNGLEQLPFASRSIEVRIIFCEVSSWMPQPWLIWKPVRYRRMRYQSSERSPNVRVNLHRETVIFWGLFSLCESRLPSRRSRYGPVSIFRLEDTFLISTSPLQASIYIKGQRVN